MSTITTPLPMGDVRRRLVGRLESEPRPTLVPQESAAEAAIRTMAAEIDELRVALASKAREVEAMARRVEESNARNVAAREAGRVEGHQAGLKLGLEKAQVNFQQRNAIIAAAAANALALYERTLHQVSELAEPLAFAAVERVIGDRRSRRKRVAEIVAEHVFRLRNASPIRVRVSNDDFPDDDTLRQALATANVDDIEVKRDPLLATGGVRIELKLGEVDAGVDKQLDALRSLFVGPSHAR